MSIKHTKEPWHAPGLGEIHAENHAEIACILYPHQGDEGDYCGSEADAQRIVNCVNACAGMNNPIKEIKSLRAKLAAQPIPIQSYDKGFVFVPDKANSIMMNCGADMLRELQNKLAYTRSLQDIADMVYMVMIQAAPKISKPQSTPSQSVDERAVFEKWFLLNQDDYECEVESSNWYDLMAAFHAGVKARANLSKPQTTSKDAIDAERWRYYIETCSGEAAFELTGITDASNEQINAAIDAKMKESK